MKASLQNLNMLPARLRRSTLAVVLGQPHMLHALLGTLFGFVNLHIALTMLPLYTLHIGGSELDAGWQTILFALTSVLFRFYFGPVADQKGRRFPLLLGSFIFATSPLLWLSFDSVYGLSFGRIYHGIGVAAFLETSSSLVADLVPGAQRGLALGLHRLTVTCALMVGPPVAAEMIILWGYDALFILCATAGICSFLFLTPIPNRTGGTVIPHPLKGFRQLLGMRAIRTALMGIVSVSLGYGAVLGFLPIHATQLEMNTYGIWFTLFALGGLVAGPLAGSLSDKMGRMTAIVPSMLIFGIGVSLLYFLPATTALAVSSLMSGIGLTASLTVLVAWIVDESGDHLRATGLSLQENAIDLSFGVVSLAFGALAVLIGYDLLFAMTGAVAMAYALYLLPRRSKMDETFPSPSQR